MMLAYSLDLRERVVTAYEKGDASIKEIAERFTVGQTFVKKMLRQKRERNSLERLPQGAGAKRLLSDKDRQWLKKQIKEKPDSSLQELREKFLAEKNMSVSLPTLCRELKGLRLPQKKSL